MKLKFKLRTLNKKNKRSSNKSFKLVIKKLTSSNKTLKKMNLMKSLLKPI